MQVTIFTVVTLEHCIRWGNDYNDDCVRQWPWWSLPLLSWDYYRDYDDGNKIKIAIMIMRSVEKYTAVYTAFSKRSLFYPNNIQHGDIKITITMKIKSVVQRYTAMYILLCEHLHLITHFNLIYTSKYSILWFNNIHHISFRKRNEVDWDVCKYFNTNGVWLSGQV